MHAKGHFNPGGLLRAYGPAHRLDKPNLSAGTRDWVALGEAVLLMPQAVTPRQEPSQRGWSTLVTQGRSGAASFLVQGLAAILGPPSCRRQGTATVPGLWKTNMTQHKELWDLNSVLKHICIQCAAPVVKYHAHYGSETPLNCLWFLVHSSRLQRSKAFKK